jgi:hypothetical protein
MSSGVRIASTPREGVGLGLTCGPWSARRPRWPLSPVSGQSRDQAGRLAYPLRGSTWSFRSCSVSKRPALRLVGRRAANLWGRRLDPGGVVGRAPWGAAGFVLFGVGEGCLDHARKVHRFRRVFGAGAREHNRFQQAPRAMRLKVDPPTLRDDLLVPARVGMPCANRGQHCDPDPAFEQRQRSARPRGFSGAGGVLESAIPRGAGRGGLASALAAIRATGFPAA